MNLSAILDACTVDFSTPSSLALASMRAHTEEMREATAFSRIVRELARSGPAGKHALALLALAR